MIRDKRSIDGRVATPRVLIDGIFFQYLNSGIARVWRGLLEEWAKAPAFAEHLLVLDRAGTAPRIKGLHYLTIKAHDYAATGADSFYLQSICDEEHADLFVLTYYTTPTTTPSIFFGYDMIPEMTGADLSQEVWREKHRAIEHASVHIMISHSSARDLERLFPVVKPGSTVVAHCGVAPVFRPANAEETVEFRRSHGLTKPYFLVVGDRSGVYGYKNGFLVFRALSLMAEAKDLELVCVGGQATIEPEFKALGIKARMLQLNLNDDDLRIAYSGAAGFIYPSRYEGFGLPILEAMACGCPVITCRNSSIPEIAGDAALYVGEDAADELADAMRKILDPETRGAMIAAGLEQAQDFTLVRIADTVKDLILRRPSRSSRQDMDGNKRLAEAASRSGESDRRHSDRTSPHGAGNRSDKSARGRAARGAPTDGGVTDQPVLETAQNQPADHAGFRAYGTAVEDGLGPVLDATETGLLLQREVIPPGGFSLDQLSHQARHCRRRAPSQHLLGLARITDADRDIRGSEQICIRRDMAFPIQIEAAKGLRHEIPQLAHDAGRNHKIFRLVPAQHARHRVDVIGRPAPISRDVQRSER